MKTIKTANFIQSIAFCFILFSCQHSVEPQATIGEIVYFNSFESVADTVGWSGYGAIAFRSDAPPGGGKQSLFVSGGCVIPHAYVDIATAAEDNYLIIRCWGKNLGVGGGVWIEVANSRTHVGTDITDKDWAFYTSRDTLFCRANQTVRLCMVCGGIVSSEMLVDLVEVVRLR